MPTSKPFYGDDCICIAPFGNLVIEEFVYILLQYLELDECNLDPSVLTSSVELLRDSKKIVIKAYVF